MVEKEKKPGKREPWKCEFCGDELLMWRNCRKAECTDKRNELGK